MVEKTLNEKEIRELVKEKVNHSGLPLEENVAKLLQKYFMLIRRNAHYLDKDELKDRDIDFLAKNGCYWIRPKKKKMRTYTISIQLIVECKKSSKYAWVFSGEDTDRISLFEKMADPVFYPHVLIPEFVSSEELPRDIHIQEIIHPLTRKLFTADGYLEINFSNKKLGKGDKNNIKDNKSPNLLRKAILQVTKASRHCQDIENREDSLSEKHARHVIKKLEGHVTK